MTAAAKPKGSWPKRFEDLDVRELFDVPSPLGNEDHPMVYRNVMGLILTDGSKVYGCNDCKNVYEKVGQVRYHHSREHLGHGMRKTAGPPKEKAPEVEPPATEPPATTELLPPPDADQEERVENMMSAFMMIVKSRDDWKAKALEGGASRRELERWQTRATIAEQELKDLRREHNALKRKLTGLTRFLGEVTE